MSDAAAPPSRRHRRRELRVIALAGLLVLLGLVSAAPAVAATHTVTNLDGSGPGSLQKAITDANSDSSPPVLVDFSPGLHGLLNLTGALQVTNSMTITGPGAGVIDVDGDNARALDVSSSATASVSGLEFSGGGDSSRGGAIYNDGTLTVSNSVFADNHAGGNGASCGCYGGAIDNEGTLTVSDSTFTDNTAGGAGGSGTGQYSGAGIGGAIYNFRGALTVMGSTFTGNRAGGAGGDGPSSGQGMGGAIYSDNNSSLTVTDSTLTANKAGGSPGTGSDSGQGLGGARALGSVTATLEGDTIDANAVGSAPSSVGAGFSAQGAAASFVATIVSGNTGGDGNCSATGSTITARDSLEGPAGPTTCNFDLPSADPLLGPLADNGGPTETQALAAASPAIGAVLSSSDCSPTDQRGTGRPPSGCDVGGYEVAPPVIAGAVASGVGTTSATLGATASNPDVLAGTVAFQYGTSTAYGSTTAAQALAAGSAASSYDASLGGLVPGMTYHFRVVAHNPDGTVYGPGEQFTTTAPSTTPSPPSTTPSPPSTAPSPPSTAPSPPATAPSPPATAPSPPSAPASSSPSNRFVFGKVTVAANGKIKVGVNAPGAGRFTAKATFTARRAMITHTHGKHVTTTFTYGTATMKTTGESTVKLVVGLSARAAKELKLLGSRRVTIAVTFTPTGGTAHRLTKNVTVKHNRKGKYT